MFQTSSPRVFMTPCLRASKVSLRHTTAPAVKMERSRERRASPSCWTWGRRYRSARPARPARPSSQPKQASPLAPPRGCPGAPGLLREGLASPAAGVPPPLPQPAASHPGGPRPEEVERPTARVPHAAAPKAADRAPGRSWRLQGRHRAPAQRQHSAQAAAEQPEAAGRHRHGREPRAPGPRRHLPPPGSSQLQVGFRPHPARGGQYPTSRGSQEGTVQGRGQGRSSGRGRGEGIPGLSGGEAGPKLQVGKSRGRCSQTLVACSVDRRRSGFSPDAPIARTPRKRVNESVAAAHPFSPKLKLCPTASKSVWNLI